MIALETDASMTSSLVMEPAPERSTRVRTASLSSAASRAAREEESASAEPCTSALTTRSTSLVGSSPSLRPPRKSSWFADERDTKSCDARRSRSSACRTSATERAFASSVTAISWSPAAGSPLSPTSSIALLGPAESSRLPVASESARTRPHWDPATTMSPTLSVPFCTSAVATAPWPTTCFASTTTPAASRSGLARRSMVSASRLSCSSSAGRPEPVLADRSVESTSPPKSSSTTSCSSSCILTLLGSASGLSILLTATTIGTSLALAALIDWIVCSLTPSSAATTSTTMSVMLAPRARMSEKAAWPGVSMKVIVSSESGSEIWYAPMCCVMPPASPDTTLVSRSASSSDVLPWSTCPMIVTIGGRLSSALGSSSSSITPSMETSSSSMSSPMVTFAPKPSAILQAVSTSIDCVMEASVPIFIRSLTTSAAPTPSCCARLPTVIESSSLILTGPVGTDGGGGAPRLPLAFLGLAGRAVAMSSYPPPRPPPRFSVSAFLPFGRSSSAAFLDPAGGASLPNIFLRRPPSLPEDISVSEAEAGASSPSSPRAPGGPAPHCGGRGGGGGAGGGAIFTAYLGFSSTNTGPRGSRRCGGPPSPRLAPGAGAVAVSASSTAASRTLRMALTACLRLDARC
mmetsp:Transcript_12125/g.32250  ORF Transcript_12125/g.32250 Transcript_12125/m.32250 type:complete len:634 (-) Transcript_12125:127-2028(-)